MNNTLNIDKMFPEIQCRVCNLYPPIDFYETLIVQIIHNKLTSISIETRFRSVNVCR